MSAFDDARRYISQEHNSTVQLRDRMGIHVRKAIESGDLVAALGYREALARLEGKMEGLAVASTQLTMVRNRIEETA